MTRSTWDTLFLRAGFVALVGAITAFFRPFGLSFASSFAVGAATAVFFNLLELRIRKARLTSLFGACLGSLLGGVIGLLFVFLVNPNDFVAVRTALFFRVIVPVICGFVGLLVGIAKSDAINLAAMPFFERGTTTASNSKLLDTSVLIDGRVAEIAEAGFLEGLLIVPQFVLNELQLIADSADSARRNRGRRGLDIVARLQKMPVIRVEISTSDHAALREVDLKLIEEAKLSGAKIITNDFNLNKLAQVQGVGVMNINELANAVRPVVLPGESMRVFILREGKELGQGIAYLEDGTMVVVDNARRHISKTVDVVVTSVLQTTAGKMIFSKLEEKGGSVPDNRSAAATGSA